MFLTILIAIIILFILFRSRNQIEGYGHAILPPGAPHNRFHLDFVDPMCRINREYIKKEDRIKIYPPIIGDVKYDWKYY